MAHPEVGYEKKDVNVSNIVGYALVAIIILIAILVFLNEYFIFQMEDMKQERDSIVSTELRDIRAAEEEVLNSYKVMNADKNIYQIPIDRAMKLLSDEAFTKQKK